VSETGGEHKLQPIVFIDDAHTFGGAQIALAWAIRAVLHRLPQPVLCICTATTREAIQQIAGDDEKLRYIECPPALPLNLFSFPLRLRSFHKLLAPLAREGVVTWSLNLSGIEFCLAPLFILRHLKLHPIAWLHNNETFLFYSAKGSPLRRLASRIRDAIANRWLFGLYPLIVTPSYATENSLRTRFHGSRHPRTGFLHPYVGLQNGASSHRSETCDSAGEKIDLWMIGRVEYSQKNNLAGLEVLKELRMQGKSACLTVVGDGVDMAHFRISTQKMGLSEFVHFRGWQQNPWELVPDNAIILIPSFFESFCLVAREAMLYGARMVVSPLPVFFEWIPGELIAPDFSAEAFANKVEEVSSMSRERMRIFYTEALQMFTEDAFVAKFESLMQAATTDERQLPRSARAGRY